MKLLLLTVMIWATASARPEMYKENEDFQYSRSSTDEGSKSGYYGAQRGNMGGNYEKAHNMDGLAQHQMSGLVSQVDGEIGEGHNTRAGDVFAAANSRGTYGSRKYDHNNLQGRNFGEGTHVSNSQSHSSLSSQNSGYSGQLSSQSSGYSGSSQLQNSGYSGYRGTGSYDQGLQSSNLQSQENTHSTSAYGAREQSGYNSGHYTESAYQGQGSYGNSNANQYSSSVHPQNRLIWTVPVRIVGRPGSRVAIPVGVQNYDTSHSAVTSFDENAINSEAEILNNPNTQTEYQPSKSARHYESSYNYRKQWEKHDTKPEVVVLSMPTENPLPKNSELHEGAGSLQSHNNYQASNSHRSNVQSAHNTRSESSQSLHHSGYNSQYDGSSGANSNAYTQNTHSTGLSDVANSVSDVNSKPKSYHSSYSYHKSWERQGDPYEIKPVGEGTTGQESQRLTSASNNQGYGSSHRYSNQHHQSHQSYSSQNGLDSECDENGHVRVTRSVGQQSRTNLIDLGNLGQQTQDLNQGFDRPERGDQEFKPDLGQQTENLGQLPQNSWGQLEDFGQQSQVLGQQSQNSWGSGFEKLEDLGQQSQDLGQQSQNSWGSGYDKLEDLGQQSQDLGQQSQNTWGSGFDKLENLGQQSQDLEQQTQNGWGQGSRKLEDIGQQTQNFEKQTQNNWGQGFDKGEDLREQSHKDLLHQSVSQWNDLQDLGQSQNNYNQPARVDIGLEPPPSIQDTGPVIQAWTPIEHQHKVLLNIPTVKSHIPAPVLDVYISVNPNLNTYSKYNDQTIETSTINNDFTINEYINQQNKNTWDDEKDFNHKNKGNRQIKTGPVQFLKGSQEPDGNRHKPGVTLPKHHSYFYRGFINPARNNLLIMDSKNHNNANDGQQQSYNYSIQRTQESGKQYKPNNDSMKQTQTINYDGSSTDYQKNTWGGQDNNYTHMARDKSNQLKEDSMTNTSVLDDTPGLNHQQYPQNRSHYIKSSTLNAKVQDIGPGDEKPDEALLNTYHANSHNLSLPTYVSKAYKTSKEMPETHANPLYRPDLKKNITRPKEQTPSHEQKITVQHAQDLIDQPEVYPDLKIVKKKLKKKKKIGFLEKALVEQKNVDDLVEQRDDLSQEIWEQNFLNLGKERNIGQGQEKKINSKEQSEEVLSIWDQMNQEKEFQWNNHLDHLNMSLQKLKYHKKAVDDFIYANTGSIPLYDNSAKKKGKNFTSTPNKKVGDTSAIELAYLKEIQIKDTTLTPPSVKQKRPEPTHSPLWNAMESYYTFAKDIVVSWFD